MIGRCKAPSRPQAGERGIGLDEPVELRIEVVGKQGGPVRHLWCAERANNSVNTEDDSAALTSCPRFSASRVNVPSEPPTVGACSSTVTW